MSKPIKIEQAVGPNYYRCLMQELVVASTALSASSTAFVQPATAVNDYNGRLIANKYTSTGDFYFISGSGRYQTNYLQLVTEGFATFYTKISIDGVNWATAPIGITGSATGGSTATPVNVIAPINPSPAGLNYRITVSTASGNYYINLLN